MSGQRSMHPSNSAGILDADSPLSPRRLPLPKRRSELTLNRSESSRSASPVLRVQVPPNSLSAGYRPRTMAVAGVQPGSPLGTATKTPVTGTATATVPGTPTRTQPSAAPTNSEVAVAPSRQTAAGPPDAVKEVGHTEPRHTGQGRDDGDDDDVAVLRANNAVLQRNVETLKELAQRLSTELKAVRKASPRQSPEGTGGSGEYPRVGNALMTTPVNTVVQSEVRFTALRQQHQHELAHLHSILARKDATIAELSEHVDRLQGQRLDGVQRVLDEKNAIIASLVAQIAALRERQ